MVELLAVEPDQDKAQGKTVFGDQVCKNFLKSKFYDIYLVFSTVISKAPRK